MASGSQAQERLVCPRVLEALHIQGDWNPTGRNTGSLYWPCQLPTHPLPASPNPVQSPHPRCSASENTGLPETLTTIPSRSNLGYCKTRFFFFFLERAVNAYSGPVLLREGCEFSKPTHTSRWFTSISEELQGHPMTLSVAQVADGVGCPNPRGPIVWVRNLPRPSQLWASF